MATLERDNRSLSDVARHLGLRRQSVYVWQDIPIEWVADIAEYSGIAPRHLRPDLASEITASLPDIEGDELDKIVVSVSRVMARIARHRIDSQTAKNGLDRSKSKAAQATAQ